MPRMKHFDSRCCTAAMAALWFASAGAADRYPRDPVVTPVVTSCTDEKHLQLTLGLPEGYSLPKMPVPGALRPGLETVCVSSASGSPYQLLNWLENSHLQAAILPEFAVAVLVRSDPEAFADDYLVLDQSPFEFLTLNQPHYELSATNGPARGDAALAAYHRLVADGRVPRVVLPHHLSATVDQLFASATGFADASGLAGEGREEFFGRLTQGIVFRQPLEHREPHPEGQYEYRIAAAAAGSTAAGSAADRDVLVLHRQVASSYPGLEATILAAQGRWDPKRLVRKFSLLNAENRPRDGAVEAFYRDNYTRYQSGSVSHRYFRFTIPELWGLLEAGAPADELQRQESGLALVLTGGGVKAAYQTRLVELLYQGRRLRNRAGTSPPESHSQETLPVDYVIGTSGGALLGIFVSSLNDEITRKLEVSDTSLTSILWGEPGRRIQSWTIFPPLDMLRYGSIVVGFLVLFAIGAFAVRRGRKGKSYFRTLEIAQADAAEPRDRGPGDWLLGSWPWVTLLFIAPLIIVLVARSRGVEHVPELSGVLYLIMVLVAADADQRFAPTGAPVRLRELRSGLQSILLFAAGVVVIGLSLGYDWQGTTDLIGCEDWSRAIVWCTGGFTLIALAFHRFLAHQRQLLLTQSPKPLLTALMVCLAVVLASQLVVLAGTFAGMTSVLELTSHFWVWTVVATAVFAALTMVVAAATEGGKPRFPVVAGAVAVMYGRHPARHWKFGQRRLTRFLLFGAIGWLWWNLVAAPGLYGNCRARTYFNEISTEFAEFAGQRGSEPARAVPFVITATSLAKSQERYFLFPRGDGEERSGISNETWFRLVTDPRWLVVPDAGSLDLQNVAFASGSPFPVFSSHAVTVKPVIHDERFIDGGFAHNRPLDAARGLGARKVLVLNSTPLATAMARDRCTLGELSCNVTSLVSYLWERSQTEDNLSSMTMFVASLYPTPLAGRHWPSLTDFMATEVDLLIRVADEDIERRIGVVESWGAPVRGEPELMIFDLSSFEPLLPSAR